MTKPTTIKEFKEWMNRFPEDTIVEFAFQQSASNWEAYGPITFKSPQFTDSDSGEGWEFTDFTNNEFVSSNDPWFGKKFITFGEKA